MGTGKTTGPYTTVTYNSQDMTASITSINGIGITNEAVDVTTLAETIKEALLGQGTVSIGLSGQFNNTATTGAHPLLSAQVGSQTGVTALIKIGIRAAPTTNDPKFTASVLLQNYLVDVSTTNVTWTATLVAAISNSAAWGTV